MKKIRITEGALRRIVKESINNVINEAHVIDKQFGMSGGAGSFENALVDAWRLADDGNRRKLELAFPNYFPSEAMYGNEQEPFDFREFSHYDAYKKHYDDWKKRNRRM